jgi:hypothetical protein
MEELIRFYCKGRTIIRTAPRSQLSAIVTKANLMHIASLSR